MSTPNRSYVVKINVGGVTSTRIWHSESSTPMTIGHPMRWVLERSSTGVTARNVSEAIEKSIEDGKGYHTVPKASATQPSRSVTLAAIEKGASFELPELRSAKTPFSVEIKPVELFPAAFETHPEGTGPLKVYACRGDWTLSSRTLKDRYEGMVEHESAFRIDGVAENRYRITSRVTGLSIRPTGSRGNPITLNARESRDFSHDALQGHVIRAGEFEWKIEAIREASRIAAADVPAADIEREQFKRATKYAVSAVLAFMMLSALWPKSEVEETLPTQATRLVLKKPAVIHKFATAAAQGDRKARDTSLGNTPSKHPKGTQMAKTRRSTKRSSPTVAKAKDTGVKHVAKAQPKKNTPVGTQHAPKRPSPVVAHNSTPSRSHKAPGAQRAANRPRANPSAAVNNTAMAQAFSGSAFKNASKSALSGGLTPLLKSGRLAGGSDGSAEAKGIAGGGNALSRSGAPGGGGAGGGVGTRGVEIAALGGGSGLYGVKGPGYGRGSHAAVSGQGKSFVAMSTDESDVDEGLTREQVEAVFQRHKSEIRYCYEAARLRNPDAEGKLPLSFSVNSSGRVAGASARGSSVGDSKLDSCLVKRLVTWQFPRPTGGTTVAVNKSLTFKALGR